MKRVLKTLLILVVAMVLGMGSALWVIYNPPSGHGVLNGAWWTDPLVGSAEANMYVRAIVARIGLFALNKTETIYCTASSDDQGEPLRGECDYVIGGEDMDARWWSITAYGSDHFLIPNEQNRHSFNMKNVHKDDRGQYRIRLSSRPQEGDWLPSAGEGDISLMLRLYNPAATVYDNLETTPLPRIVKEGCP
ncbi:MAG: DUF1214 domain-containing protein [Deltaproteobacteria bacterium]|nr:DUF1214 domain-containing protein [Deltaproteobacteria bacterium]